HLALGDASAALQVYATCRARLAQELQIEPSADTVALASNGRAIAIGRQRNSPARPSLATTAESRPSGELAAPLVGRATAFSEWVAWARAQRADVLVGQAFEMGGRLPYQPLVEALRGRLEAENAPEDLLSDLWLAELARLLPELRVRYPDLPAPAEDELGTKM